MKQREISVQEVENIRIEKENVINDLKQKLENILGYQEQLKNLYKNANLLCPVEIELPSIDEKFLKEVVEAVDINIENPNLDVEMLSQCIGLSSNQTYRKLKSLTGQTIKEFIRNQRLKAAAYLLEQNKRSISEIVYMVGFTTASYFTRCFKEYYGCTPTTFIERNKTKQNNQITVKNKEFSC